MLNEVFGFLNLHALLRSENIEKDMKKFKNIYADDVNFSELTLEIARFNTLVGYCPAALHFKAMPQRWMCC